MVNQDSSTTTVSSTADPSVFGQAVTFTATVSAVAPGVGTPTGTITFTEGSATLAATVAMTSGQATFTTSAFSVATHTITASYSGDGNFQTSTGTDSTSPQVVNQDSSSTTISSSVNPSVFGQVVTFTATVSAMSPGAGTPSGTVTFEEGSTTLAATVSVDSSGKATFSISSLSPGTHTITALYKGDGNFLTSSGSDSGSPQVVTQLAGSSTAVTSSPRPSVWGQTVTFTATVSTVSQGSGTPTGTVTFMEGSTTLASVALASGIATYTTSALAVGTHTISASYSGDSNFPASSGSDSSAPQVVNKAKTSTVLTVSSALQALLPSPFNDFPVVVGTGGGGTTLTLTATVAAVAPGAGTPTGMVTFTADGIALATESLFLNSKQDMAVLVISGVSKKSYTFTATYGGDSDFSLSVSEQAIDAGPASAEVAYSPSQIRSAYGINDLSLDGTGQTIAIVDAYDNPAIYQALDTFDTQFGLTSSGPTLYHQYGPASSFLTVLNQSGQATLFAGDRSASGRAPTTGKWKSRSTSNGRMPWPPAPRFVLVEANSQSLSDLMAGVATAASQPGVSVVSMSWGFPEGQAVFASDEATYDSYFNEPGVTFVASTGDYGAADPEYPAFSPNVVAVGGTSLDSQRGQFLQQRDRMGLHSTRRGVHWLAAAASANMSRSRRTSRAVQSTGSRTTPDVSLVADPATGAWIADPYNLDPGNPFEVVGGTSLSAPAWAGLDGPGQPRTGRRRASRP